MRIHTTVGREKKLGYPASPKGRNKWLWERETIKTFDDEWPGKEKLPLNSKPIHTGGR